MHFEEGTMTTKSDVLSEATLQAAFSRAVVAEIRQNGKLVSAPGMSEEEKTIRAYDATWDEEEARRLQDAMVARGERTRAEADAHLQYLVDKAVWSRRMVEELDAQRAAELARGGAQ
jgi:hypothetical protein